MSVSVNIYLLIYLSIDWILFKFISVFSYLSTYICQPILIYLSTNLLRFVYIYIYVCVCVSVCVRVNFFARFSHIFSWWSFAGFWVTTSLLRTPGLVLGFLLIYNNAKIFIVSIRPPICNALTPISKPLGIVPRASITDGITTTLIFHGFF